MSEDRAKVVCRSCGAVMDVPVDKTLTFACCENPAIESAVPSKVYEIAPPKKQGRWSRFLDGLGEALGEYLFGGRR